MPLPYLLTRGIMRTLAALALAGSLFALPACSRILHTPAADRGPRVLTAMRRGLCGADREAPRLRFVAYDSKAAKSPLPVGWPNPCAPGAFHDEGTATLRPAAGAPANGTLIARQLLASAYGIRLDLVAYQSDGLAVAGLLCYPADGKRHSTVVHIPGQLGGIFSSREMVQTCIDWALAHGRVAFTPSLRGNDGGDGHPELCLGEANDVAAAATLLRTLEVVDPARLAIVGGSLGGCIALRASAQVPNLRAVVAYVPPTYWKGLVQFHRTQYRPDTEITCDGTTREWNIGGPPLADVFDSLICGKIGCTDAQYDSRSPIPGVLAQTAPTMILSAGADNVVPIDQQMLWSQMRQEHGHPVDLYSVASCDAVEPPRRALDVHLHVRGGFHLLNASAVSAGLVFLMNRLDEP